MQVGSYRARCLSFYATLVALIGVCAAGCDRAKPEKLTNSNVNEGKEDPHKSGAGPAETTIDLSPLQKALLGSDQTNSTESNPTSAQANSDNTKEVDPSTAMDSGDKVDLSDRTFMTLNSVKSDRPEDLVAHLGKVDAALRDLILAGANKIVGADTFNSSGMRLGQMKLTTGEKLASLPDANAEQRKLGTVAQLVALSHMSGLKDIESAKKLEQFAGALLQSSDPDLAHQGRVVLLGFRLQDLQNGNVSEPTQLLTDLEGLFQRPSDAGFPEMMVLQQARTVLSEMGFSEAAGKIDQLIIGKYMDSPDSQLSSTAWSLAIINSQSFRNYNAAMQDIYEGKEREPQMLLGAVRALYDELPNATTLLQFVNLSTDLEYRGLVNVASELSVFIKSKSASLGNSAYLEAISAALDSQERRLGIRGQSLELDGLVDLDGNPLDWSAYKGKVVLIDFWATWCMPCLKELPNIRTVRDEFGAKGFEVLSINMDENLPEARMFLTSNPLPWKTYHSSDLSALGFKSTLAKRLGINAIPFLVLVGTDGKVAAVHVRGDRLAPSVRSMLGDGLSN
jgi:thiol-disulfide isomerase/thioredoxin